MKSRFSDIFREIKGFHNLQLHLEELGFARNLRFVDISIAFIYLNVAHSANFVEKVHRPQS